MPEPANPFATSILLANKLREDKMTLKLRKRDSVEYLKTEEDMAMYLEACIEEAGDDAAFIAKALGTIARAHGITGSHAPHGNQR